MFLPERSSRNKVAARHWDWPRVGLQSPTSVSVVGVGGFGGLTTGDEWTGREWDSIYSSNRF